MNDERLKRIQSKTLQIYKEIKKLCDEHGVRYFAIGGTAIGTVRHMGFIPWDDDIDIAMPRKDYEKFKKISHLLPGEMEFHDYSDIEGAPIMFGKVQDINTCYTGERDLKNPDAYYGIFVDIMPLDGVPENTLLYKIHWSRLRVILLLQNLIVEYENGMDTAGTRKAILRSIAGVLSKLRIINKASLKKSFLRVVSKYDFDRSTYSAYIWQFVANAGVNVRARFRTVDFERHLDMPFEDTTMRMAQNYKGHLGAICPDYMTPPPKEKRIPHHTGIVDFNKSYLEYAKGMVEARGY